MKKKITALLVLLALVLGCAIPALADETAEEAAASSGAASEPAADTAAEVETVPDRVGFASFENVESRMRANNLKILSLQQSIGTLEDIDYAELEEDLRDALHSIVDQQWGMIQMEMLEPIAAKMTAATLEEQYDAVKEQLTDLREGKLQADNAGIIRQIQNAQNQIILAGESTFIALKAMETQEDALQRQLTALNRTVEEMELRYQLGQISALQLSEVKAGRSSLTSGLSTLRMNMEVYKAQLEQLLGAEITGQISLGTIPTVTAEQVAAINPEADLAAYKEKSYELYEAKKTLEEAQEEFEDARDEYKADEKKQEYRSAQRTWQAAQYTYNDTVQSCELKFQTICQQVKDYQQIWEAAKVSLACQQESYKASELKFQQGTISQNALLTAGDDLRTAEEKVENAASDLFSAYNTYCWAVQHGILN
ncbi:MAG: TolC family protein [Oscillospiraceae bacterium]|nr:TolC family protein [Oscillospiraceae bacterium]